MTERATARRARRGADMGVPTGKMTPITLQGKIALSPGPHKLTFTVGREKFTFQVKIESGKVYRFNKDLQVQNPAVDP